MYIQSPVCTPSNIQLQPWRLPNGNDLRNPLRENTFNLWYVVMNNTDSQVNLLITQLIREGLVYIRGQNVLCFHLVSPYCHRPDRFPPLRISDDSNCTTRRRFHPSFPSPTDDFGRLMAKLFEILFLGKYISTYIYWKIRSF